MMTEYVIYSDKGYYLKNHPSLHHWTDNLDEAKKFNSMSAAEGVALIILDLNFSEYEIKTIDAINKES